MESLNDEQSIQKALVNMDPEKRIFELLLLGEEQHKAIKDVLDAIRIEREQLAQEQKLLREIGQTISLRTHEIQETTQEVIPELKNALGDVISSSMTQSITDVSREALRAVSVASSPILQNMDKSSQQSETISRMLENAVKNLNHRWIWFCGSVAFLGILGVIAIGSLISWWQHRDISQLQEQRQILSQDIKDLEKNLAILEKKGGRIRMERCGPNSRLCIEVAPNQGNGIKGYRGPWGYNNNGRSFVIPKGY